jgi:hypothetical protein
MSSRPAIPDEATCAASVPIKLLTQNSPHPARWLDATSHSQIYDFSFLFGQPSWYVEARRE